VTLELGYGKPLGWEELDGSRWRSHQSGITPALERSDYYVKMAGADATLTIFEQTGTTGRCASRGVALPVSFLMTCRFLFKGDSMTPVPRVGVVAPPTSWLIFYSHRLTPPWPWAIHVGKLFYVQNRRARIPRPEGTFLDELLKMAVVNIWQSSKD